MESGSGIQELMAAETRASQIVAEARIGECLYCRLHHQTETAAIAAAAEANEFVGRAPFRQMKNRSSDGFFCHCLDLPTKGGGCWLSRVFVVFFFSLCGN